MPSTLLLFILVLSRHARCMMWHIPCADWKAWRALLKWCHCLSALVFLFGVFVKLAKVFTGRCRCSMNGKKRATTYVLTVWSFISLSVCLYFDCFRFVSLQNTFCNFVTQVVTQVLPTLATLAEF